jgi:hypothetical protein
MSDHPEQRGKQITIYADASPHKSLVEWNDLLQRITQNLTSKGVPPGYRSPGTAAKPEAPIPGSNYITYRYEKGWPPPGADPCQRIRVNVDVQLPNPPWQNNPPLPPLPIQGARNL